MKINKETTNSNLLTITNKNKQSMIRQIFNINKTTMDLSSSNKNLIIYNNNVYFKENIDNKENMSKMLLNVFNISMDPSNFNKESIRKISISENNLDNIETLKNSGITEDCTSREANDNYIIEQIFIPCINCNNLISYMDIGKSLILI